MLMIRDNEDTADRLALAKLLQVVANAHQCVDRYWRVLIAGGYGDCVYRYDTELESSANGIIVRSSELLQVVSSPDEGFYDLGCIDEDLGLVFGLFDSSFLFIEGNPVILDQLADSFLP